MTTKESGNHKDQNNGMEWKKKKKDVECLFIFYPIEIKPDQQQQNPFSGHEHQSIEPRPWIFC